MATIQVRVIIEDIGIKTDFCSRPGAIKNVFIRSDATDSCAKICSGGIISDCISIVSDR